MEYHNFEKLSAKAKMIKAQKGGCIDVYRKTKNIVK